MSQNQRTIKTLQELVALNESLKKQITSFKEACKQERDMWTQRTADLQKEMSASTEEGKGALILETYASDTAKLNALRSL